MMSETKTHERKLTTPHVVPMMYGNGKTLGQLSERQQAACYSFGTKWGLSPGAIAPHLDILFRLDRGELTLKEAEERTGLTLFDATHPSLFDSEPEGGPR